MLFRALFFCLFAANAFACALCSTYSPTAHVQTRFETNSTTITTIKFTWSFSENFSGLMITNFDLDASGNIDKNELAQIRRGLTDYVVPRKFLTFVEHYAQGTDAVQAELNLKDYELYFDDEKRLKFEVVFTTSIPLELQRVVSVEVLDVEGAFAFKFVDENSQPLSNKLFAVPNFNGNIAFYTMLDENSARTHDSLPSLNSLLNQQKIDEASVEQVKQRTSLHDDIDAIDRAKFDTISQASVSFLDRLRAILRANSQEFSLGAFVLLVAVSFGYGFLHAAGAGHGKLLTASYFAATGGSYVRAGAFALRIGFLHVIGAAGFVGVMFWLLQAVSNAYVKHAGQITTAVSGAVIVIIGVFMLYRELKFNTQVVKFHPNFSPHKIYPAQNLALKNGALKFSHDEGCGCAMCEFGAWQEAKSSNKRLNLNNLASQKQAHSVREWLLIAAAALVPCPGTILVFTLAFELGSWGAGLASGVAMGLGMGAVIFIAAVFGAKINATASFKQLKFYAQIVGISLMIAVGVFMLVLNFTKVSLF